ncbi:MAG: N-methylhydantoinase A, partial [Gammaproteobacteria bacterium]
MSAEVRYVGQGNTVEVLIAGERLGAVDTFGICGQFEAEYLRLYRKLIAGGVPEVVTWRISGSSRNEVMRFELAQQAAPSPSPSPSPSQEAGSGAALGERSMYLPSTRTFEPVAIFDRYRLPA